MALLLRFILNPGSKVFSSNTRILTFKKLSNGAKLPIKKPPKQNLWIGSLKTLCILTPAVVFVGAHLPIVYCKDFSSNKASINVESNTFIDKTEEKKEPEFPWKDFWNILLPYTHWLLGAIVGAIAVAYLNIQIPLLLGEMVNVVVKYNGGGVKGEGGEDFLNSISTPVKKLIFLYALQGLCTSAYIALLFRLGEGVARDLKVKLFNSLIIKEVEFFDKNRTGDLISRLTIDIQEFKSSFKMLISQGLKNAVQTTGHVVSMIYISPQLTLVIVGMVVTMIVLGSAISSVLSRMSRRAQQQKSISTIVAEEAIGNLKTVRAFAMEDIEMEKFKHETQKSCDMNDKLGMGISIFQGLSNISINSLVLTTLLYGGWLMSEGVLTAGSLMSLFIDTQAIQRSLNKLSILYGVAIQGKNAGCRVFEHILTPANMDIKGGLIIPHHSLHGDISFQNISFTYPTRKNHKVLTNFSLDLKGGSKVALVGPSGGGKSTIAALLERFYDVQEGSIKIDGVDIKLLDPSWIRSRLIGYISQEPVLFASSIKENIRYGRPEASDEEVIEAAKLANADDFITTFPHSYDTVLGERGLTISGGQKQRIAIARALIKKPPMLILDEATSALDTESEQAVQKALDGASKGRTVLMIAHRLSTIKDADYVAVIQDGAIVEYGKPEDLKKKKGVFWHLMKNQH